MQVIDVTQAAAIANKVSFKWDRPFPVRGTNRAILPVLWLLATFGDGAIEDAEPPYGAAHASGHPSPNVPKTPFYGDPRDA